MDCILGAETSLDVAEVAVVEALERLLEAARDHRTYADSCARTSSSRSSRGRAAGVSTGAGESKGAGASASARRLCVG